MSGRMLRWQVPVDDADHELRPVGPVLAVGATEALWTHLPAHWVEFWTLEPSEVPADDEAPSVRVFRVFGTGQPIPDGYVWRGTCARLQGLVWHLAERADEPGERTVRLQLSAADEDQLVAAIRRAVRRHGGDARAALGGGR